MQAVTAAPAVTPRPSLQEVAEAETYQVRQPVLPNNTKQMSIVRLHFRRKAHSVGTLIIRRRQFKRREEGTSSDGAIVFAAFLPGRRQHN